MSHGASGDHHSPGSQMKRSNKIMAKQDQALRELRELEAGIIKLKRVAHYQETGEETELCELIEQYRSIAQQVIQSLAVHFRESLLAIDPYGNDEPMDASSAFINHPMADNDDNDNDDKDSDDIGRMLAFLHIDDELVRYSSAMGDFY